ncbi:MAG: UvrD-helicase domain-containing protein [Actinomycetota bacterium]
MSDQQPLPFDSDDASPPEHDPPPPDHADRSRIEQDLATTLFVEAGAGSGKTTALVQRIVALVDSGIELENVAAITFTEKAAAELRQRVREVLEARLRAGGAGGGRFARALDQLDGAAISTLHAFAQRLLFEHPLEAGLPPGVEVLDEIASQVDFEDRWDAFVPELLATDDLAAPLLVADVLGVTLTGLRSVAHQFEDNWDLLAARLGSGPGELGVDVDALVGAMRRFARAQAESSKPEDKLVGRMVAIEAYADALHVAGSGDDPVDVLTDLAELLTAKDPRFMTEKGTQAAVGAKTNWPDGRLDELREELFSLGTERNRIRDDLRNQVITTLGARIGRFVLDGVAERRTEGRLRFHDLLVLARELLRNPESGTEVRQALRDRYRRLLIDEFQDTDPIQVEIACLLAAAPEPGDTERTWQDLAIDPGRLFFVGDPKQSIYRFRRADIATYLDAQTRFGASGASLTLATNFRSSQAVLDWVNGTFGQLIQHKPGSQPAYQPLLGRRGDPGVGPGVALLGEIPFAGELKADELRSIEAALVAETVSRSVAEGWTVGPDARPARLGDITILLPARTSLGALEQALEAAGIPYRAETASLVYATPEVRDLLIIARAIDDPTDELAVVSALRTTGLACGDDDLYRHRVEHGLGWNHQLVDDDAPDTIVVQGLRWMGALHRRRAWHSPAQVLERIVADRHLMQLGVLAHRHREVWRRLRFVVDQARAWTDATGGDLRQYLTWVRLQASDSARVAETVLPETDTDAVRIMTVHASKGLEFPITIVSGLTTRLQSPQRGVRVVWPADGGIGYRLDKHNVTPEYERFLPIDEQLDVDERLRLLYVACTRARDHLVVSTVRTARSTGTFASVLAGPDPDDDGSLAEAALAPVSTIAVGAPPAEQTSPMPVEEWERRREEAIASSTRSRTVAATTVARMAAVDPDDPGHRKEGRNLDLPPWQKGRYGTAVGRAVHAVLQTVDLSDPSTIDAASAAQAAAEGVVGAEEAIAARCRSAIGSPVVQEAAAGRHWREIFVAAPVGERLLEGYVDLLHHRSDGLVVIDYKTDAWQDEADLDTKVERYRLQTAAYATALEASTALPVVDAVLLFLADDEAVARHVPDLAEAMEQVRTLVPTVLAGGEASAADI